MSIALYVGSFDPLTLGHLDVIERTSRLFERVIVGVGINPAKRGLFTPSQRVELAERCVVERGLSNVTVESFEGLTVQFARSRGVNVLVKGVRGLADVESELAQAQVNRDLAQLETLLLPARPELSVVSSSLLKELWAAGMREEQLLKYAPAAVVHTLQAGNAV